MVFSKYEYVRPVLRKTFVFFSGSVEGLTKRVGVKPRVSLFSGLPVLGYKEFSLEQPFWVLGTV